MFGKDKLSKDVQLEALAEMRTELESVKAAVEDFDAQLQDTSPSDLDFGGGMDEGAPVDEMPEGGVEDEGKEKEPKIKTPEDAKKALEEAKKDISNVVENLDGLCGQAEEEEKLAGFKRVNEKYATTIASLASNADKAIKDAKGALKHWAFLLKLKKTASPVITDTNLNNAVNTIVSAKQAVERVEGLFKEGTSVPPTGAKFTGDKWPNGKDPKNTEDKHWNAGAEKFKRDKKWEDARPNPAVDERLTTVEYTRDDKPYVNANLHTVAGENSAASYWDIQDTKENKRMFVTFASLPDAIGPKDARTLGMFNSSIYGKIITANIVEHGFDFVKDQLEGKLAKFEPATLAKIAADSKSNVRKYYSDAYGDKAFSKAMTAGKDKADMDVAYKPKDDSVKAYDENTKDGPGKLSNQVVDKQLIRAKADRAMQLAVIAASRGLVPFNASDMHKAGTEYMKYSDAQFKFAEDTYSKLPVVNASILKASHIPDAEAGIVGNTHTAVSDPKSTVDTKDLDSSVSGDAKISAKASFVPQANADNSLNKKPMFASRLENSLNKVGALNQIKKPTYKTS